MTLELSEAQETELRGTLAEVIREMSGEIADTDNPSFRRGLEERRECLRSIVGLLPT